MIKACIYITIKAIGDRLIDMKLDYSFLLEKISTLYEANTIEQKIVKFCKDVKIKVYRFKRIIEGKPKCYFMNDEMLRSIKALNIKNNEISKCFFTQV